MSSVTAETGCWQPGCKTQLLLREPCALVGDARALQRLTEAPGAVCWGGRLGGPMRWNSTTTVSRGRQPRRGKSHLLLQGPCALGWKWVCPVAAHRGTLELPAGAQGSWRTRVCAVAARPPVSVGQQLGTGELRFLLRELCTLGSGHPRVCRSVVEAAGLLLVWLQGPRQCPKLVWVMVMLSS